ncbi:acetyl-CoA C-acetyltransferase [Rhabdobacter roseus]|uniref:Acetyl-CoA C-acetyltransferase n=1 Tax=Rhabdobacter roseus TaxID=1655419 RepID=A0A840TUY0_9BACT|nr:acetyl-CoA C-acetyltransferase [Rhabdobacter roseus]MBB5285457.1 acetyl-CoA C-acetyltransferase [Rhabdobacter roseus]
MTEALIYDAVRTPRGRGKADGALHEVPPLRLLTTVLEQLRDRNQLDTTYLDDVLMGCVTPLGEQGADIARTAVLAAGYAESVAGVQLNRFCSSGLEAINMAAAYLRAGQTDLVIAGGVESMSRVAMGSDGGALFMDPAMVAAHNIVPQGISADLIATRYGYSRAELDALAAESYRRAEIAQRENRFAKSLVSVYDALGTLLLGHDEGVRPGTTAESLGKLKPAFEALGQQGLDALALMKYPELSRIEHVHHAGNSSQIADGAAGLLMGTRAAGERLSLKPRARIRATAVVGSEPTIMLTGPVPAAQKVLRRAGLSIRDIDLWEVNEAFAAVPMYFMDALGVDPAVVNVNGGGIAMGHPLGATGAILTATLLDELERRDKTLGLVTLCIGGGMGIATIIERVN